MRTQTKTKSKAGKATAIPAPIVGFEIPADHGERAKTNKKAKSLSSRDSLIRRIVE